MFKIVVISTTWNVNFRENLKLASKHIFILNVDAEI